MGKKAKIKVQKPQIQAENIILALQEGEKQIYSLK